MSLPSIQSVSIYLKHLTSLYPGPFGLFFQKLSAIVFGACLVAALAAEIYVLASRKKKDFIAVKLGKKIFNGGLTMGLIGFLWLFFAREQIYVFSGRFWFLIWFAAAAAWKIFILRYALKEMPKEKAKRTWQARISKYLPRNK